MARVLAHLDIEVPCRRCGHQLHQERPGLGAFGHRRRLLSLGGWGFRVLGFKGFRLGFRVESRVGVLGFEFRGCVFRN